MQKRLEQTGVVTIQLCDWCANGNEKRIIDSGFYEVATAYQPMLVLLFGLSKGNNVLVVMIDFVCIWKAERI